MKTVFLELQTKKQTFYKHFKMQINFFIELLT